MIQKSIESIGRVEHTTDEKRTKGFADIAAVASNLGAIEAGMRFAEGITPFVAIIGAPGWGKSHLVSAVAQYMHARGARLNRPMAATIYATFPDRIDESLPLLLDDVQDAWTNMRTKQELRRLLERRVKSGRPTLVALADVANRQETARFLPNSRDWGCQVIQQPSKAERDQIVRQIADSEGVRLSKPVVTLVSRHLCGNGRSIQGAVHTLRLVKPAWSRRDDVCEACGVLMPYIQGENGWDPRDVVLEVVTTAFADRDYEGIEPAQVCAYMLISKMGLSEYDVATFLGVSPTRAYAMSNGIKLQLADFRLAECVQTCVDAVVRSLDMDSC
jgi:chromosomal replication initiation ATPase DnaA